MSVEQLQQAARDHLWLHFTRMGGRRRRRSSCAARAATSRTRTASRYLDALAGLFAVQIGYSYGEEIGQAALEQMRELPFYTNWSYAHPRAIELAHEVAQLAPGDLQPRLLRLRRLRGRRVRVEARPPVPPGARRAPLEGDRPPRRLPRHDDGSALDQRHRRAARRRSSRSCRTSLHVRNTNRYHRPAGRDGGGVHGVPARGSRLGDRAGRARDGGDGDHGAGAERGRLRSRRRRLLAGRARDLRPVRSPALRRRGDHRLRPPRRRGSAPSSYDIKPDLDHRARRVSRRRTRRSALSSRPTASSSRSSAGRRCTRTASPSVGTRCSARSR